MKVGLIHGNENIQHVRMLSHSVMILPLLMLLPGCGADLKDARGRTVTQQFKDIEPGRFSYEFFDVDPMNVCSTKSFYNSLGELVQGEADCSLNPNDPNLKPENIRLGVSIAGILGAMQIAPPACKTDGETGCTATSDYTSVDVASLAPKIAQGVIAAGISGTYVTGFVDCISDGEAGCIATARFKAADFQNAADKIIQGYTLAGTAGNVTLPSVGSVLTGISYGVAGTGFTGTLTLPAAANVLVGSGTYGNPATPLTPAYTPDFPAVAHVLNRDTVNGVAGTLTLPAAANVRVGNGAFGVGGNGSTPTLTNCSSDGGTGCVVVGPTMAAAVLTGAADKILFGESLGGISGNVKLPAVGKVLTGTSYGVGGTDFTGTLTLPAAADVLAGSGNYGDPGAAITPTLVLDFPEVGNVLNTDTVSGVAGTLTLPGQGKVLSGTSYGVAGNGSGGTLTLPAAASVLSGTAAYGEPGSLITPAYTPDFPDPAHVLNTDTVNGSAGTLTLPPVGKVLDGTVYGASGNGSNGTLTLPAAANVRSGTGTYGDPDSPVTPAYVPDFPEVAHVLSTDTVNGVTGTLTLPSAANVSTTNGAYGVGGNGTTPTLADCTAAAQSGCFAIPALKTINLSSAGSATGLTATNFNTTIATNADFEFWDATGARHVVTGSDNLAAGNIKNSVTIFGVTGQYPSATYRLAADTNATDLTEFVTQLTTDGTFEFFDSAGGRYTGSGDSEIKSENILAGVQFENLSVTGSHAVTCRHSNQASCIADNACQWNGSSCEINPWNIRTGITILGKTGSTKTNCRNLANSAVYNSDAVPSSNNGITGGTAIDWWDTLDPKNGLVSGWGADTKCDWEDWEDLTPGGCDSGTKNCMMKDRITGLIWSENSPVAGAAPVLNPVTWSAAVASCENLVFGGYSDWRLPTQLEFQDAISHGLITVGNDSGTARPGGNTVRNNDYFMQADDWYWTATTISSSTGKAVVWAADGSMHFVDKNTTSGIHHICVR